MTDEYRVEIKVKNNNILKRIEDAGYKTVGEFCRLNESMKHKGSTIGEIINMKKSPLNSQGNFHPFLFEMADILSCSPESFFSDVQLHTAIESNKRTFQVNEAEMQFMLANTPDQKLLEDIVSEDDKIKSIEDSLDTLTPREQKVIELRFGLNGNDEHTLREIGEVFGVTSPRIRDIEAKALRKLRHPSRGGNLREFVE